MPKILALLSDRQLAQQAGKFLRLKGFEVDAHTDPQKAILSADTVSPDLVVIDIHLAGRSGIEFLYELRSYSEWQELPVIAVGPARLNELEDFIFAFSQLKVSQYLAWPLTSLPKLEMEIRRLLVPTAVTR